MEGGLTIAASAVHFANVEDLVVTDGDAAAAIMLNHLILSILSSSANDEYIALAERGHGILAHFAKPDIAHSAAALAVYALKSVRADDDVLERGAFFEEEDGVLGACVSRCALHAAVKLTEAEVLGLASGDGHDLRKSFDVANAVRDAEALSS